MSKETFEYNGIIYRRYPDSSDLTTRRYFRAPAVDGYKEFLHRVVYADHHGAIPDGFHVHHIDGDTTNNAIDNLEALPASQHIREHITDIRRQSARQNMVNHALPVVQAWQKTEIGRKHRSETNKAAMRKRKRSMILCAWCLREFVTKTNQKNICCSNACKLRKRRWLAKTRSAAFIQPVGGTNSS